ncbi:hypothetical protein [Variovorax sp. 278MFTsu5.1]|uniref:hypothetical protein n=1 Tax=Variovorax sp. 278MFTsu5.1 TaxID=3158366 RepID=UPI003AAED826
MNTTPDFSGKPVRALIDYLVKGDREAAAFLEMLFAVVHLWDDLVDGDKQADTSLMMFGALIALPRDPFYQRHFAMLSPLMEMAMLNWLTANELERTNSAADKRIAFITRSDYLNVALMSARIVGGWDWAREVAATARRQFHIEGYEAYIENLRAQFAASSTSKE